MSVFLLCAFCRHYNIEAQKRQRYKWIQKSLPCAKGGGTAQQQVCLKAAEIQGTQHFSTVFPCFAHGRAAAAHGAVIFAADSAGHQQSRRKKLDAGNDHQGKMCAQLVQQIGEIEHGVPLVSKKAPHCNAEQAPCAVAGTGAYLYTIDILRLGITSGP